MHITFDDVRLEPNTTYFFFSNTAVNDMEFCLKNAGVTDYEIHGFSKFHDVLPAEMTVPHVKLVDLPNLTRLCRKPVVMISHMNIDDLRSKLQAILRREDDDLRNYHEKISEAGLKNYDKNHKWHEGKIPVSAEQKG